MSTTTETINNESTTQSTEVAVQTAAAKAPEPAPVKKLHLDDLTMLQALKGASKSPTFRELMNHELLRYNHDFSSVGPNYQLIDPTKAHTNVALNTSREFKPEKVALIIALFELYRSPFVTRQMVIAVNKALYNQVSCPNDLNKNAHVLTSIQGLYRLPEWILTEHADLVIEVAKELAERAEAYREMKKAEAALAAAKQAEEDAAKKLAEASKPAEAPATAPATEAAAPAVEAPAKKAKKGKKAKATVEAPAEMPAGEILQAPQSDSTEQPQAETTIETAQDPQPEVIAEPEAETINEQ